MFGDLLNWIGRITGDERLNRPAHMAAALAVAAHIPAIEGTCGIDVFAHDARLDRDSLEAAFADLAECGYLETDYYESYRHRCVRWAIRFPDAQAA